MLFYINSPFFLGTDLTEEIRYLSHCMQRWPSEWRSSLASMNQTCLGSLDTERCLGNSCSSRKAYDMREDIEQTHYEHLSNEIKKVIQEKYIVVCIVHDYHCIHCLRKPNDEKTSDAKHMCAVVVKIFPEIPAIDLPTNMEDIHNPKGISPSTYQVHIWTVIPRMSVGLQTKTLESDTDYGDNLWWVDPHSRYRCRLLQ